MPLENQIIAAQAGQRIQATITIKEPGARFGSSLSSHYANMDEVNAKLEQLKAENPTAQVILIKTK